MTVPYVGAICLFAGIFEIKGWLFCDGRTLQATENTKLYEAIGNKYGGDKNSFAIPNLIEQEKVLNGVRYQIAIEENLYAPDPILGSIFLSIYNTPPDGYAFCDGAILSINQYQALYSILQTNYGGNGYSTFGLPDLTEAEKGMNGVRFMISLRGVFPTRA